MFIFSARCRQNVVLWSLKRIKNPFNLCYDIALLQSGMKLGLPEVKSVRKELANASILANRQRGNKSGQVDKVLNLDLMGVDLTNTWLRGPGLGKKEEE